MYPGKILEDIGSSIMVAGVLGVIATLFATLDIAAFPCLFLWFAGVNIVLCLIGHFLLSIGYKKHIKWCKDMGYIK